MITQADLKKFRELKRAADEANRALSDHRNWLLDSSGDGVDDGPLQLQISHRKARIFSHEAMVDLFGKAEADRIKALLPEKESTVVTVVAF